LFSTEICGLLASETYALCAGPGETAWLPPEGRIEPVISKFFRTISGRRHRVRLREAATGLAVRFRRDTAGNIALSFAIALLPILAFVGAAIDYTIMNKQRSKIQAALDEAILAGAIAGKQTLDAGSGQTAAIAAANAAAAKFFSGNTAGMTASISTSFTMSGLNLSGTGSASGSVPTTFLKAIGDPSLPFTVASKAASAAQPYLNVYLLVDISASMLLPSTTAGITQMRNGRGGCALACHDQTDGTDSYSWALDQGIQLRYQVVNQGVQNLLNYLMSNANLSSHVKVQLWSIDSSLTQLSSMTSSYSTISNNFPAPGLASTDASAATPFDSLIGNFISSVGNAGDGSSSSSPQKMVIIATDGVNDPTRAWTWDASLRPQVKVFDTTFCTTFKNNGVTVAIINTPYYPMTWDWGYNVTLGQPGSLGGATRVDDIPIALSACAGKYFTSASTVSAIQSAFTNMFVLASPIRLTN
jgi:Flp pilus assembly protein TadG